MTDTVRELRSRLRAIPRPAIYAAALFAGVWLMYAMRLSPTYLHELPDLNDDVLHALTGTAQSKIVFQLGQADARYFEREFSPFDAEALQALPAYEGVARLSIHGQVRPAFGFRTYPLPEVVDPTVAQDAVRASNAKYAIPAAAADEAFMQEIRRIKGRSRQSFQQLPPGVITRV